MKSRFAVLTAACVAWTMCQAGAVSAAILASGFELHIAPSDRLLNALGTPQEAQMMMEESCDNPHNRIRANNKPAIMLENTSGAGELSSLTLNINSSPNGIDVPYYFGTGDTAFDNFTGYVKKSIYSTDGVNITGSAISPDGSSLTVTFADFAPGKRVIFNIDLDTSDPNLFPFPDFRSVLHGAPLAMGQSATNPGDLLVKFVDEQSDAMAQLGATLEHITEAPIYANDRVRPYHTADPMAITEIAVNEIPEPTATVLAGLAVIGGLARRRRS